MSTPSTCSPLGTRRTALNLALLSLSLVPLSVWAESQQLEAVVVTATKVGEVDLQETPASISVYDRDALNEGNRNNIEDLKQQTPGLNVTRNGPATRLYLRGVGTNLDFIGSDPSVTVHVDGVYQSRSYSALDAFLNVKRIEVLRGPQGTLYGRNSTGGTINIITRLPDAAPEASVSAEAGNFNLHRVTAMASGGLGSDNVIGSVALMQTEHDPYIDNTNPGGKEGLLDDNSKRANASLRTRFGSGHEAILRADYSDRNTATGAYKSTGLGLTGAPAPLAGLAAIPEDEFDIAINLEDPFVEQTSWGNSAEFNIALAPGWVLTSLTAFRKLDFATREDTDGTRLSALATEFDETQDQISQELRVRHTRDTLTWVGGLFLLRDGQASDIALQIAPGLPSEVHRGYAVSNDTRANALFTEAHWQLAPSLNATLGARYSTEEKRFENIYQLQTPANVTLDSFTVDEDADWDDWSPNVGLDYTLNSSAMIYANVSKGFKSGGFNFTSSDAQYDQEELTAYEIGAKLDWLSNTARTNVAMFYYDYTDLQVQAFSQPGVLTITNAASAISQGAEIENEWLVGDAWAIELNYAYLDAAYDRYIAPTGPTSSLDVSGNRLNASPEHKVTPALRYYLDSAWGLWSARLEYAWQDKQYFTAFNEETSAQDDYGLVNMVIGLTSPDEQWEAQLLGHNLTDEDYATSSREFVAATTGVTRDINPPRTVSARMTYRFR